MCFGRLILVPAVLLATALGGNAEEPRPKLAVLPETVPAPSDNPTSAAKIELGRQLFFDPRLSGDNTLSCSSCHLPEQGFADGKAVSNGAGGAKLKRNTPTVLNAAFLSTLTWDGRHANLEAQALAPIESAEEMHQDLAELERELQAVPEYARQFKAVFDTPVTRDRVAQALAAFERSLVTRRSPLDRSQAAMVAFPTPG
jgi:cytochrome c peroxidase